MVYVSAVTLDRYQSDHIGTMNFGSRTPVALNSFYVNYIEPLGDLSYLNIFLVSSLVC